MLTKEMTKSISYIGHRDYTTVLTLTYEYNNYVYQW